MKRFARIFAVCVCVALLLSGIGLLLPGRALADNNARDYIPAPAGTLAILTYYENVTAQNLYVKGSTGPGHGGTDNLGLSANEGILRPIYFFDIPLPFDLGPMRANIQALFPFGGLNLNEGSVSTTHPEFNGTPVASESSSGFGAPFLVSQLWLLHNETTKSYIGIAPFVFFPTGAYQDWKAVNIGTNNWQFREELNGTQGFQVIPGHYAYFEVTLGSSQFTDNNDATEYHQNLYHAPTFTAESHLSYDLTKTVFVSADYYGHFAGNTRVDPIYADGTYFATQKTGATGESSVGGEFGVELCPGLPDNGAVSGRCCGGQRSGGEHLSPSVPVGYRRELARGEQVTITLPGGSPRVFPWPMRQSRIFPRAAQHVQSSWKTTGNPLIDPYQRRINYLRLSVTDRCNLRCLYCMPSPGVPFLPHEDILRYEELERIARIAISLGITKIRLTGGEPLVRRDLPHLCERIARLPELESLSLTTNGVLLSQFARDLFNAGISRLNISLDTLNPEQYASVTGKHDFFQVWKGIHQAHVIGFQPIKINVVVMRGLNDEEIGDLASLTYTYPFHVRFIELMQSLPGIQERHFFSGEEIEERLRRLDRLLPAHSESSNGPARYYRFPGALGKIGLITPVTQHFCHTCNRLRVTADGRLRNCLFGQEEADLRSLLRRGAADEEIEGAFRQAIWNKPRDHSLNDAGISRKCLSRPMSAIGG